MAEHLRSPMCYTVKFVFLSRSIVACSLVLLLRSICCSNTFCCILLLSGDINCHLLFCTSFQHLLYPFRYTNALCYSFLLSWYFHRRLPVSSLRLVLPSIPAIRDVVPISSRSRPPPPPFPSPAAATTRDHLNGPFAPRFPLPLSCQRTLAEKKK